MNILVAGGAGYIGSHMVKFLARENHQVTTLDNLSKGYKDAVIYGDFIEGDIGDSTLLNKLLAENKFDAVMHFASFIEVGESIQYPDKYFHNNVEQTKIFLDALVQYNIDKFIFSSSAAIFGNPDYCPIDEAHPTHPINPYGQSKLMVEEMLQDYDEAHGLKSTCLRYFNAAGADPEGELGERHNPESHLIPLILQAASGRRKSISIFGNDYDTNDGTCIRDYIHINDLCSAHLLALEKMNSTNQSADYNLGNGKGFSVREVIDCAKRVTNCDFEVIEAERREGDPAILVADATKAKNELSWKPAHNSLEEIINTAWQWEKNFLCKHM